MFEPHMIKKEPVDSTPVSKPVSSHTDPETPSPSIKCTCKKKRLPSRGESLLVRDTKSRQVLVNFGLSRKKVFTLNRKKDRLHDLFTSYVLSEPAFSKLLKDSYVVFQEFSHKFGTWVDINQDDFLDDGTILKAVFFPSAIERDDSNPGSIKRKKNKRVKNAHLEDNVIQIDSSDENEDQGNFNGLIVQQRNSGGENKLHKKKKEKKKKEKEKKLLTEDNVEENNVGDLGNTVKKEHESSPSPEKSVSPELKQEKSSVSLDSPTQQRTDQGETAETVSSSQEPEPLRPSVSQTLASYNAPQTRDSNYSQDSSYFQGVNHNQKSHRRYEPQKCAKRDLFLEVYRLCEERGWAAPQCTTRKHFRGWTCKVWVRGETYFARHSFEDGAKDEASQRALNDLTHHNGNFPFRASEHRKWR